MLSACADSREPALAASVQSAIGASGVIPAVGDFNGDGRAEPAAFDPQSGRWYFGDTVTGATRASDATGLGAIAGTLRVATGDFNGDHATDVLLLDDAAPGGTAWYVVDGRTGHLGMPALPWGTTWSGMTAANRLALGDYDGDGRTDRAILVEDTGGTRWYIIPSTLGYGGVGTPETPWGWQWAGMSTAHELVLADYDGDGRTDKAFVDRGAPGGPRWYIVPSTLGYGGVGTAQIPWGWQWAGLGAARIAVADFDGDHQADRAIVADGDPAGIHWAVIPSRLGYGGVGTATLPWDTRWNGFGSAAQLALGDYDGDGAIDPAVTTDDCRTYVLASSTGGYGTARMIWGWQLATPTCDAHVGAPRPGLSLAFDHCAEAVPAGNQHNTNMTDDAVVSWYGDSKTVGSCQAASGAYATLDRPLPFRVDDLAGGALVPRQRARAGMSLRTLELGIDGLNAAWAWQIDHDPSRVIVIGHGTNDATYDLANGVAVADFEARLNAMVALAKQSPSVASTMPRSVVLMEPYRACTLFSTPLAADDVLAPYVAAINRVGLAQGVEVIHAYSVPIACPRDEPDGIHASQAFSDRIAALAYETLRHYF